MSEVGDNCRRIFERIYTAAARSGRDVSAVRLVAVTKTVPVTRIREAIAAGVSDIGENRLQEALAKREALADLPLVWHFIGHLQTNKAKRAVEHFDWIHCLDRSELADKLNSTAARRQAVLIEVKLEDEPSKSGVVERELESFIEQMHRYDRLHLRGLMAIPPFSEDPEGMRPYFRRLATRAREFALPELSMGMSNDFEIAIEEGATMVRIGTAIFGQRT